MCINIISGSLQLLCSLQSLSVGESEVMKRKHFHVTVGLVLQSAQTLFTVKRRVCSFLFPLRLLCCLYSQTCTQTVFSLDHLCPCVLCFLSEAEKKARLTSKTGSQQSVNPPSQVYESQWNVSKPRSATVIPLNTHSFKSCANERLIVRTTLRSPSLDPSRASLYRTLTSTSSHILFSEFSA